MGTHPWLPCRPCRPKVVKLIPKGGKSYARVLHGRPNVGKHGIYPLKTISCIIHGIYIFMSNYNNNNIYIYISVIYNIN